MPKAQASVVQFCTHAIVTGQVPLSVFAEEAPPGQSSGLQGLAPEGETPALWRPLAASRTHHSLASANNLRPPPTPGVVPGCERPFCKSKLFTGARAPSHIHPTFSHTHDSKCAFNIHFFEKIHLKNCGDVSKQSVLIADHILDVCTSVLRARPSLAVVSGASQGLSTGTYWPSQATLALC